MTKIGFSLSMIGGILFFTLTYFFARHYYLMWSLGGDFVLGFLFYLFINAGAIIGAILGIIGKKFGYYLCLLIGISFPLVGLYLSGPYFFIYFFKGLIDGFYIYIPWSILFIGGITGFIELRMELRKNNQPQIKVKKIS